MDSTAKETFHRKYMKILREVAKDLGLVKGTFDVRSNKGGFGILGEVTLHGEAIYLQVGGSCCGPDKPDLYYRVVKGRKDYTGGVNRWDLTADKLTSDRDLVIQRLKSAIESGK